MYESMVFDQYSRYCACDRLLRHCGYESGKRILDVGSGVACLLQEFIGCNDVKCIDPLIATLDNKQAFSGDIFELQTDGSKFSYVTAVDVLEHIKPALRKTFLERISRIASEAIIIGFPASDNSAAVKTDQILDQQFKAVFGKSYPWLKEHFDFGLPSSVEVCDFLTGLGWNCQVLGHGKSSWLQRILGQVLCLWEIPFLKPVVHNASLVFNRELAPFDYGIDCYRSFVVASREKLPSFVPPVTPKDTEQVLDNVVSELQNAYFTFCLKYMKSVDERIIGVSEEINGPSFQVSLPQSDSIQNQEDIISGFQKNIDSFSKRIRDVYSENFHLNIAVAEKQAQLMRMSDWADEMNKEKLKLQGVVKDKQKKIEEVTGELFIMQDSLAEKQKQLMEMSDWADGMRKELEKRNAQIPYRAQMLLQRGRDSMRNFYHILCRNNRIQKVKRMVTKTHLQISLDEIKKDVVSSRGQVILVFSIIEWDFRWQRPQQMLTRVRDSGYTIIYVSVSISFVNKAFKGQEQAADYVDVSRLDYGVYRIGLHSEKPLNIYSDTIIGDDLQNMIYELQFVLNSVQVSSITYLVHFPGWWPVIKRLKDSIGGGLVYDCMDDHSGFNTSQAELVDIETELIVSADWVIASSGGIDERCRCLNPNTIQIKNGTDFQHFSDAARNGKLDHLPPGPIIGYYGAISDWFDMDLVAYCAEKRKNWNFVLIGSTFGADLTPINGLKNVFLLGEQPYNLLPGYLAYFDICSIPFKIIPLTEATNPVKFYEYMSAGKPVVSTMLPELIVYSDYCNLARTSKAFLAALDKTVMESHDDKIIKQRRKFAMDNSWDQRVQEFLTILK